MRVCKVWDAEYPWDVRVEKVASSLTRAGHTVDIVARNRKGLPLVETLPEGTVHRLAPLRFVGRRLSRASMFPAFMNPRWIRAIHRVARSSRADLILVRDLPLAPTAVWVGRRLGVPVVLDMAENYPAMIRSVWQAGLQRRLDWLVRNPSIAERVEQWVLRRVDHTLVVVEESKERLVAMGVPTDRVTVVCNTPGLSRLAAVTPRVHTLRDHVEVIYLGLLEAPRGIGVLIEAARRCHEAGVPVALTLIGDGRERPAFEQQARENGLGPEVIRFMGYLPNQKALELLQSADVGVVPHIANESWNSTIPNKLFDYMAAGLAVLSSDAKPAARIVRQTGAGEVYPATDAGALAAALERMRDPEVRARHGAAGREAVRSTYNWEMDAARMEAAIRPLARGPGA